MATSANLRLVFNKDVQVTVTDDGRWQAAGDPHQVLNEDSGNWVFHPTAGTDLSGLTGLQVTLVGWRLSMATTGEEGTAYRYPQDGNELGSFKVMLAV